MKQRMQQVEWGAGERAAARLVDMCGDMVDVAGGRMPSYPRHSAVGRLMLAMADEIERLDKVAVGDGLTYESGPGGRILTYEAPDVTAQDTVDLYDVVTIGGWSMTVDGWNEGYGDGVQTVNGFYGEQNHRLAVGLTRGQVEDGQWCWGLGNSETHFAIVIVDHGNKRDWPETFPHAWWNYRIPEEQIYGRSIGENGVGGPVCLRLRFGVYGG